MHATNEAYQTSPFILMNGLYLADFRTFKFSTNMAEHETFCQNLIPNM